MAVQFSGWVAVLVAPCALLNALARRKLRMILQDICVTRCRQLAARAAVDMTPAIIDLTLNKWYLLSGCLVLMNHQ